jgi:hypothetical protein
MAVSIEELKQDTDYVVTIKGEKDLKPIMLGKFMGIIRENHPLGARYNERLPVAKIQNDTERKVGYYDDKAFTFELANLKNTELYRTAEKEGEAAWEAAFEKAAKYADKKYGIDGGGRRRKTKKSKRRSRKTRRRHR